VKTSSVIGPARLVCVRALVLAALAAALAFPSAAAADDLAPPTDALQALQSENVVAASASVPAPY